MSIKAELWLSKAKEDAVAAAMSQYYVVQSSSRSDRNRSDDRVDNGEWLLMVVVAQRLCGEGKWEGACEEFESALKELKDINDKTTSFQGTYAHLKHGGRDFSR
jgi:hypothetical protein